MKLSPHSIRAVAGVLHFPGKQGPRWPPERWNELYGIVRASAPFFNPMYDPEPPRVGYTQTVLERANGSPAVGELLLALLDERDYVNDEDITSTEDVADHLNRFLRVDGYQLRPADAGYQIVMVGERIVAPPAPSVLTTAYVVEASEKAEQKLLTGDYSGAVTSARTLMEEVVYAVLDRAAGTTAKRSKDLPDAYQAVTQILGLGPKEQSSLHLKQMTGGLFSIVNGLATLRNKGGDAHARAFDVDHASAALAVNAARTFASFIVERASRVQPP